MSVLLAVGLGYSAKELARRLQAQGWRIIGTSRTADGARAIDAIGYEGIHFDGTAPSGALSRAIGEATHLLVSASPGPQGDPLLAQHAADLRGANLQWVGYLSTIGVYGNHDGKWVDEETPPEPTSERGKARVAAERAWAAFAEETGVPLGIFRLSGIYGPGRGPLEKLRRRESRAVIKPGQVFNRIHVEDIATALEAAIARAGQRSGARVYNVTDDEPAPPQDVLDFAADLIGLPHPPRVPFDEAEMSPMARSFYSDNKRTSNARMKAELGVRLRYPTYREGLRALAAQT
ncbi:SDR family oxidoreductase [Dichotomicrobium thermohalophilum]|uniref:Nucleoside-diphosphate-sugar epimerase n=1 Tax=Dichotomicrobium thermohalophilum TaxID=933063 RepID=A0A397Q5F0_9HYPH|nr:SDR family oxidoreductase [Dichotomicrobium thermohalophilum]RIA56332.1 nucleoside-diphosphate-sugar epimerase [Dichotomicrobium thermohalophilum]